MVKEEEKEVVGFQVERELAAELRAIAEKEHRTLSEQIRYFLEKGMCAVAKK